MGDRLSSGCTAGARASLQRDGLFTMGHGIHTRVKTVTIRFSLAWLVSLALRSGLRGAWCEKLFLSFLCHDPALLLSLCSRPPIASIFLRLRDSALIFSTNSGPIFLR